MNKEKNIICTKTNEGKFACYRQIRKKDKLANSQVIRCLQLIIAYSINDVSNIYI